MAAADGQISVFTIDEVLIVKMQLPRKNEPWEMDIAFHLTRMGDYGVLELVLSLTSLVGVIENYTSAVRIDSMSHGGIYRAVDFSEEGRPEILAPLEVFGTANFPTNPPTTLSPIELAEEPPTPRGSLRQDYMPRTESFVPFPFSSGPLYPASPIDDTTEKLEGSEMV